VLQLGAGLDAANTQVRREGDDLVLTFNAADKVRIVSYLNRYAASGLVEKIEFADGTIWDFATVTSMLVQNGTAGQDTLSGLHYVGNRINGLGGNDSIYGGEKGDVLSGGAGNDYLEGGLGNDTYVFNLGDGMDTITDYDSTTGNNDKLQFGAGITADMVQLGRSGNDLTFNVNASDNVTVKRYFEPGSGHWYRVETIAFADGTTWDVAATLGKPINGTAGADYFTGVSGYGNRINGLGGNDTITGAEKDDVLDGGADNDTIHGGNGNDLLIGGSGSDTLNGGAGNDVFRFLSPDHGVDSISDFTSGSDVIQVVGSSFGLTAGSVVTLISGSTTPTASGTAAQFLYNTTSGALHFDQDGADTAFSAVHIATLTGQKNLVASDIVVIEA